MLSFTSLGYLAFLLVAAALFRLCPVRVRPLYLLVISYLFYLTYDPWAAILLAAATAVAFSAGLYLEKAARAEKPAHLVGAISILLLVAIIAFYKIGAVTSGIIAPLGISYYTFKLISYVVEVHLGRAEAEHNPILFAAFAAFFPFLVAGPIQRPADFFAQNPPRSKEIAAGILRIAAGLFKKLIIADGLGLALAQNPNAWVTFFVFPMQLYSDFSGLTDIALGSALLFGIRGPENFNRPFTATSIADYWKRWHMSLTSWLGDYVFTPLRMQTRELGKAGLYLSITVNMILIGIWHGISWSYFVFGLVNALFLSLDFVTTQSRKRFLQTHTSQKPAIDWFSWLVTMLLVGTSLVFFRAPTVPAALNVFRHLPADSLTFPAALSSLLANQRIALSFVCYLLMELVERFLPTARLPQLLPRQRGFRLALYAAVAVALVVGFMLLSVRPTGQANPFLYQQF